MGTMLMAGTELGLAWRSDFGLDVGVRGHLQLARMRGEMATPIAPDGPAIDDVFFANTVGADLQAGYHFDIAPDLVVEPFFSAGVADVSTLVIVGDDFAVVQNTIYPWAGALVAAGVEADIFSLLNVGIELSSAVPVFTTVKAYLGVVW
jgi:hypothetical protein